MRWVGAHSLSISIPLGQAFWQGSPEQFRQALAASLGVDVVRVSVKATTTDGMGFIGADEGLAAVVVVTATA